VKMTKFISATLIAVAGAQAAAADFQNLDFDDADLTGLISSNSWMGLVLGEGFTEKLLPGWTLLANSTPSSLTSVNLVSGQVEYASLVSLFWTGFDPGRFALEFYRPFTNSIVWAIQQTGTVPTNAHYLAYVSSRSELQVLVNGQPIGPLNPPGPAPSPLGSTRSVLATNLVYDVSAFAGLEVQLAFDGPFGIPSPPGGLLGAYAIIDDIRFVTAPPGLAVSRSGTNLLRVGWPASTTGYVLQSSSSLKPGVWTDIPITPVVSGEQQTATVSLETPAQFYRLGLAAPKSQ
jgi:hypothetical protein